MSQIKYIPFSKADLSRGRLPFNRAMSFGTAIVYFIGTRDAGKTWPAKRYIINRYKQNGKKFIWLRDTKDTADEVNKAGERFFGDIANKCPDLRLSLEAHEFKVQRVTKPDEAPAEVVTFGYLQGASTFYKVKGIPYNDIETIVFDEVIPEKVQNISGSKIFYAFANALKTILRDSKKCSKKRVIMTANALDSGHPSITYYGFKPTKEGFYINFDADITLCFFMQSRAFTARQDASIAGRFLKPTELDQNLNAGRFCDDAGNYITKPKASVMLQVIHTQEGIIGLRNSIDFSEHYIVRVPAAKAKAQFENIQVTPDAALVNERIKFMPRTMLSSTLLAIISSGKVLYEDSYCRDVVVSLTTKLKK